MRLVRPVAVGGVALLLSTSPAEAQPACVPADGISSCVEADTLWPELGGGPFSSQASTELPDRYRLLLGLTPTYVDRPVGLVVASPNPEGTTIYAVEGALRTNLLAGFTLDDATLFQLVVPLTAFQFGAAKADITGSDDELAPVAMGDLRLGIQRGLVERGTDDDGFALAARFQVALPTAPDSTFTGFATTTFAPGVAMSYHIGRVDLGVDLSGRLRNFREVAGAAIGTQFVPSLGVGVDALDDGWLSVSAEAWALVGIYEQTQLVYVAREQRTRPQLTGELHVPAEWMVSVRSAALLDHRLHLRLGGGSFIPTGSVSAVTTPRFRAAAAAEYTFDDLF